MSLANGVIGKFSQFISPSKAIIDEVSTVFDDMDSLLKRLFGTFSSSRDDVFQSLAHNEVSPLVQPFLNRR
jgi:hypothetical protein